MGSGQSWVSACEGRKPHPRPPVCLFLVQGKAEQPCETDGETEAQGRPYSPGKLTARARSLFPNVPPRTLSSRLCHRELSAHLVTSPHLCRGASRGIES